MDPRLQHLVGQLAPANQQTENAVHRELGDRNRIGTDRSPAVECLEPRRLLADTFNATLGNDVIEISATSTITTIKINGTVHNSAADEINVNAGAGNDSFRVLGTRVVVLVRLNGQDGDDQCEDSEARLKEML